MKYRKACGLRLLDRRFKIEELCIRGCDDLVVRDIDGMELAFDLPHPEAKKAVKLREFRGKVIILPEEFQKKLDDPLNNEKYFYLENFINSSDLIWENGNRKIYPHSLPAFMK